MTLKNTEICYLLAFPDPGDERSTSPELIKGFKDAPYFQPVDIHVESLRSDQFEIEQVPVEVILQRFDQRVRIAECHFKLEDVLSQTAIQQRDLIRAALQQRLIPSEHRTLSLFEEYMILCTPDASSSPDGLIDQNAQELARFIRSQREVLDQPEIEAILAARVRYSRNDLTLVDWESAVIIAREGNYQSDIELLKIGNYQLLRYRILDRLIEEDLSRISNEFHADRRRLLFGPTRASLRRIVSHRLEVMIDFERTDQNLLLIGDWYTAKLYHVIQDQFYLDHWKNMVKAKLDNLEGIIQTIQENFSLSWSGFLEAVQMAGWIILLVGYFVLFALESHLIK
ncbi:MAG: hypothetical protein ABSB41_17440 [Anaerolineales bacterium]|jgi:hypothetical protein